MPQNENFMQSLCYVLDNGALVLVILSNDAMLLKQALPWLITSSMLVRCYMCACLCTAHLDIFTYKSLILLTLQSVKLKWN